MRKRQSSVHTYAVASYLNVQITADMCYNYEHTVNRHMYPLRRRHTICLECAGGMEGLSQWSPVPEARLLRFNMKYKDKNPAGI